jgi:uncharacterized membrane protein
MTTDDNIIVAIYATHDRAELVVKELQAAAFDLGNLSIVGRDDPAAGQVVGTYATGERMGYWGRQGALWGGLWGLLCGSALFLVPEIGLLVVAGPVVGWIIGALEGAVVMGGLGALGIALCGKGIPVESAKFYENALKADKFLVIVHGSTDETERAKDILLKTGAETVDAHKLTGPFADSPEQEADANFPFQGVAL